VREVGRKGKRDPGYVPKEKIKGEASPIIYSAGANIIWGPNNKAGMRERKE